MKVDRLDRSFYLGFFEFEIGKCSREPRPPHRYFAKFRIQICNAADVVIVSMGEDESPNFIFFVLEVAHIGDHKIDAVHLRIRKSDATINNQNIADLPIITVLIHKHVLRHVAHATQWEKPNRILPTLRRTLINKVISIPSKFHS